MALEGVYLVMIRQIVTEEKAETMVLEKCFEEGLKRT